MSVFCQLESIFKNTKQIIDDCNKHLTDNFEDYECDKSQIVQQLRDVEDSVEILMRDSREKFSSLGSKNSLEISYQNYLCFISENREFFQEKFPESMAVLSEDQQHSGQQEFVPTNKKSNVMCSDDELDDFLRNLRENFTLGAPTHYEPELPSIDEKLSENLESVTISVENTPGFSYGLAASEPKLNELEDLVQRWSPSNIDKVLENWTSRKTTSTPGDPVRGSALDEMDANVNFERTPVNARQNDQQLQGILKSSSRGGIARPLDSRSRVRFTVERSSSEGEVSPFYLSGTPGPTRKSSVPMISNKENKSRDPAWS